ncbi:hypothetical protein [Carboxylicivirga sp. M1479]|uniref:hypothetical protein n=1 Tax=Carboxylicivirga sp. M1479 TaxID=2594476 RepID=UPI001177460E|nr:hypothetical protein [Carboxylicivirga sp. M1479]TRX72675.1 hypothetical protein FNN09_01685 [Carboxylicivirga sp. M1479]
MQVKWLRRIDINEKKWNACVQKSTNGYVFAMTWYLDIVCPDWEAVVLADYYAVLPLPVIRKGWFKRVYCPTLIPYTGVINSMPMASEVLWQMIQAIPYKHIELVLNPYNKLPFKALNRHKQERFSVLDLVGDIARIEQQFKPQVEPVVDLYKNKKVAVVRDLDVTEYLTTCQQLDYKPKTIHLVHLRPLLSYALRYQSAGLYTAYNQFNQLIGVAFVLRSNKCLSLIHYASEDDGLMGIKAIVYHMLRNNAGANLTLEFPCCSKELGQLFTSTEHVCGVYKKGLSKWISL